MADNVPPVPKGAFRVTLQLNQSKPRLDAVLLEALRSQKENIELRNISRTEFKALFDKKRVQIKGQSARPSSSLAAGTTYVDILGHGPRD